ncbi:glycosyltransferase family 2 protein [Aequorivita sp. H23M31]|uniref:Glycosyltransferase family 2 protein n=1 Tax=Aequorivita ciconiae TaxID=2494375 RepID=A0A410G7J7_9FLAO|nr:glycosyltransferase family 2 protein [Aequorivita sp. H23M31]QAA83233.1 glycosyltransferase family 2 protein [Aequorivita sp. H23M31]
MEIPLVSIVTPVYNSEKFLEAALTSVQNQTYSNWELILIDDGSTDSSESIAREFYLEDSRIIFEKLPLNKGAAIARNRAIDLAKGDFIAFLDSDDFWAPDKLEIQLGFMQKKKCDVSFSNYLLIDEDGNSLKRRIVAMPVLTYKTQLRNNYIGNLTGMYCSRTLGKVYSPLLRKRQDWGLWLEAIKKSGKPALGIQVDLAYYRKRKNSVSTNKFGLLKYNFLFYKCYLSQSTPKAIYSMGQFLREYFLVRPKYIKNL